MAKRSELPFDREAARIVKVLDRVTRTGRRPGDVFEDWLDLVEACLTQLPAHLKAAVTERKPADDPEEVKALWARVAARYDGYKTQAFEAFSEALGLLLSFSHDEQGQPR